MDVDAAPFGVNLYILVRIIFCDNIIFMVRHDARFFAFGKLINFLYDAIGKIDVINNFARLAVADTSPIIRNDVSAKLIEPDLLRRRQDASRTPS